jgi:hypothetical protein
MLIDAENDDAAVLAAEDEAIATTEAGLPVEDDGTFVLPDSLAHLLRSDDGGTADALPEAHDR